MKSFTELRNSFARKPTDCTGIDIGATVTKVVRLKKTGDDIAVVGAELVPPPMNGHITVSSALRARTASIAMSGRNAVIKLLTFTGPIEGSFEGTLHQKLGISDNDNYRVSYTIISEGSARTESSVLVAAIPDDDAAEIMHSFASGIPAPYSLEIATLSTLNAFEYGPVSNSSQDTVSLIDFGTYTTSLSVFYRGKLALIQFFNFGTNVVMEHLKSALRINADTARGILEDASFDLSDVLMELMGSVASHLIVSRDFVERQKNCSIDTLHAVGGIARSQAAMRSLSKIMSVKIVPWDPFDGLIVNTQTLSSEVDSQRWRFAGAIGAALATLEEE